MTEAAENLLVLCERLSARILPGFCKRYRQTRDICRGCRQVEEMDRLAQKFGGIKIEAKSGGAEKGKPAMREVTMSKPVRECAACGEEKTIQGRGMCGRCYHRALRSERSGDDAVEKQTAEIESFSQPVGSVSQSAKKLQAAPGFSQALDAEVCELREFLLSKNAAYGNSALEPVRIFSKADPVEQIRVRIDDKLSRLMRGDRAGEDTELDLLGYLVLLRVARRIDGAGQEA